MDEPQRELTHRRDHLVFGSLDVQLEEDLVSRLETLLLQEATAAPAPGEPSALQNEDSHRGSEELLGESEARCSGSDDADVRVDLAGAAGIRKVVDHRLVPSGQP